MTYNEQGKRIRSENLAGRIATKVAQGKGGLGRRTDMAYTVKHIQKGQVHPFKGNDEANPRSLMGRGMVLEDVDFNHAFCSHLNNRNVGIVWETAADDN